MTASPEETLAVPFQEDEPRFVLGEPAAEVARLLEPNTVVEVAPRLISVERDFNARDFAAQENKEHVERLASSIAANGVQNPIRVRVDEDRIIVADGESRLRAALLAQVRDPKAAKVVPILLEPEGETAEDRVANLIVRNTGKPLAPLETLQVVERLREAGWKRDDITSRLGFTRTHYNNLQLLAKASEATLEHVRDGEVSSTLVIDLMREHKDPEVVEEAVEKALAAERRRASVTGKDTNGKTKATKRDTGDDGIIYTRSTFNGLVGALQEVYATLVPAADFRKQRRIIKTALDNVGAPVAPEPEVEDDGE